MRYGYFEKIFLFLTISVILIDINIAKAEDKPNNSDAPYRLIA